MRLLVFQHTPGEHPAAFAEHARAAGDELTIVHLYLGGPIPDIEGFDGLLVMGGPMDIWEEDAHPWLIAEKAAIAKWISAGRPYLGICLGHQLMIEVMGGVCGPMEFPQISVSDITRTASDPIFDALPGQFPVLKWHGVAAKTLPEGTMVLANSPSCAAEAIRINDVAWGVQFHPEITPTLIDDWLNDPGNQTCALDWLGDPNSVAAFNAASRAHVANALLQSAALYAGLREAAHASVSLD